MTMKKLLLVIYGFLLLGCKINEELLKIDEKVNTIESGIPLYEAMKKDFSVDGIKCGYMLIYFDSDQLVKMEKLYFGDLGKMKIIDYFENGFSILRCTDEEIKYSKKIEQYLDEPVYRKTKIYYSRNYPIKCIINNKNISVLSDEFIDIIIMHNEFQKRYMKFEQE